MQRDTKSPGSTDDTDAYVARTRYGSFHVVHRCRDSWCLVASHKPAIVWITNKYPGVARSRAVGRHKKHTPTRKCVYYIIRQKDTGRYRVRPNSPRAFSPSLRLLTHPLQNVILLGFQRRSLSGSRNGELFHRLRNCRVHPAMTSKVW